MKPLPKWKTTGNRSHLRERIGTPPVPNVIAPMRHSHLKDSRPVMKPAFRHNVRVNAIRRVSHAIQPRVAGLVIRRVLRLVLGRHVRVLAQVHVNRPVINLLVRIVHPLLKVLFITIIGDLKLIIGDLIVVIES